MKIRNNEERTGREELSQKLENLESEMRKELQQEKEDRINLEQYTRRENLIFNRIPKSQSENCKETVKEIINDMGINADEIRFHAIHRLGRKLQTGFRPIIARFVSREDRDKMFSKKKHIKTLHPDAYITQDYARAIKEERKTLIKSMMIGRSQGMDNIKVLD